MSNRDIGKLYSSITSGSLTRRERFMVSEDKEIYTKSQNRYKHLGSVTNQEFNKITRMISSGEAFEQIEEYLTSKQYTPDSFKGEDDYRLLIDLLDGAAFEGYISQKKPDLMTVKSGNIIDITSRSGLDSTMAQRIARFTPIDKTGSNVGPGEILLALTFNDVLNSTIGGDLMIGNNKLEVKGQGGRFGQQPGRGGIAFTFDSLLEPLKQPPLLDDIVSLEKSISTIYNSFVNEGIMNQFIPRLRKTLSASYPSGNLNYINNKIDFNNLGTRRGRNVLPGDIRKALAKLNFDHYSSKYKTDLFLFVDKNSLDFAMFEKKDALKSGGLIDSNLLLSSSFSLSTLYPNFKFNFNGNI